MLPRRKRGEIKLCGYRSKKIDFTLDHERLDKLYLRVGQADMAAISGEKLIEKLQSPLSPIFGACRVTTEDIVVEIDSDIVGAVAVLAVVKVENAHAIGPDQIVAEQIVAVNQLHRAAGYVDFSQRRKETLDSPAQPRLESFTDLRSVGNVGLLMPFPASEHPALGPHHV
jgi:hypothetical protein